MKQVIYLYRNLVLKLRWLLGWFKAWWSGLSEINRYILLIVVTLAFSKAVALEEGLQGQFWTVAATLATLFAAFAAYRTAVATQATLDRQVKNEKEERRPNLILSNASMSVHLTSYVNNLQHTIEPGISIRFEASNVSQHAVNIYEIIFDSAPEAERMSVPKRKHTNHLVAPNETKEIFVRLEALFQAGRSGHIIVFFYYGATGQLPHALRWEYLLQRPLRKLDRRRTKDFTFFPKQEYFGPEVAAKIDESLHIRLHQNMKGMQGNVVVIEDDVSWNEPPDETEGESS